MPPSARRPLPACLAIALAALGPIAAHAASVSGAVFEDQNGNGIQDVGEPGIDGAVVTVQTPAASDSTAMTAAGAFTVGTSAGCHAVDITLPGEPDPAGTLTGAAWRRSMPDGLTCPPNGADPIGLRRYGVLPHLRSNLQDPAGFRYISLGDSIAAGESFCVTFLRIDADYVEDIGTALDCLHGPAINTDNRAVSGSVTEDLLTSSAGNQQYIPRVVSANPDLVTISIGGNNFLDVDYSDLQNRPFSSSRLQQHLDKLVRARRDVQEILSSLTSGLPSSDIVINTVYDNEAGDCTTTDLHAAAPPVWNQMLRSAAWGQTRPVGIAEVAPEFAHQNVTRTTCCGEPAMICTLDVIHPNADGAKIIEQSNLEALGRVDTTAADAVGFDVGYERLVAVLHPTVATPTGAVGAPDSALALDATGASVPPGASLVVSGFTLPPGVTPTRIVVGVRYQTTGTFADDQQLFDASVLDFATPTWTFEGWDTDTPLVGAAGSAGSVVNTVPNVATWRDVSSMLTLNAVDDGTVTGYFSWPTPTATDVANLKVKLQVLATGTPDAGAVEWDGAWAWVYGTGGSVTPPPDEVSPLGAPQYLRVAKDPGGIRVSWDPEALTTTYRIYRGRVGSWTGATADPGVAGGCTDAPGLTWIESPVDSSGDWFFLVAGTNTAGEGPLGFRSDGVPESAAGATCP